jgi:hypothetical protein
MRLRIRIKVEDKFLLVKNEMNLAAFMDRFCMFRRGNQVVLFTGF